jgi:hypothetical protein
VVTDASPHGSDDAPPGWVSLNGIVPLCGSW